MNPDQMIEQLSAPDAYRHEVEAEVVVHQTHISVVFLAGDYAYKLKKPVDLDFVDYSSVEARRHYCREEVRLNRRLAPDVYLGVVPVTSEADGRCRIDGDGEVVDWAVRMRRLAPERTLEARLEAGEIEAERVERLGAEIAEFHRQAASGPEISRWARWTVVAKNVRENFSQSAAQVGNTVHRTVFERFRDASERELQARQAQIDRRADEGLARDTHGDLRLEHVYVREERDPGEDLVIVDCVEFNDAFRYADPVADVAFLVMDLIGHGRRDLAERLAERYFEASGDDEGRELLDFYVAYRAAVRGKVQGIKALEPEVPEADRREAGRRSAAHWLLGLGQLALPGARPAMVLVGGLPGTGKSTVARQLAGRLDFEVIDTDRVRKELAAEHGVEGVAAGKGGTDFEEGIYTRAWSDRTYAACLDRAETLLFEGKRVIVDGSFGEVRRRRSFLEAATGRGVPGQFLVCETPDAEVRRRLNAREGDVSDADCAVYEKMRAKWEPLEEATARVAARVDTGQPVEATLEAVIEQLEGWGLA